MRRTKSEDLHPANKIAQAIGGSYNVENPFIVSTVDAPDSPFDGMIADPGYPIIGANIQMAAFKRVEDIAATRMIETLRAGAEEVEQIQIETGEIEGGAKYRTVKGDAGEEDTSDYLFVDQTTTLGQTDVYLNVRVKLDDSMMTGATQEAEFYIGFQDPNVPNRNIKVYIGQDDSIYAFQYAQIETEYIDKRDFAGAVASEINNIWDGEFHDITLHFDQDEEVYSHQSGQRQFRLRIFIDGKLASYENSMSVDDINDAVTRNQNPDPVSINFGTTIKDEGYITTTISSCVSIQENQLQL